MMNSCPDIFIKAEGSDNGTKNKGRIETGTREL
jgi:hypothetical protein